ncbi:MAG: flippase-like domain-containing protein [Verrucomicrobia bacterium]|nr:flippase-like domain-containing protein [Verrucomicrobiota bacterium]
MTDGSRTPTRQSRFVWRIVAGLLVAAGLFTLLLWRVDLRGLRAALSDITIWHVIAALVSRALVVVFRSLRWRRLGVVHGRATALDCLSASASGMLIGLAFPGLNEFTRAYLVKRRARVSLGSVLGVLMAERVLDLLLMLGIIFAVLLFIPGVAGGVVSTVVLVAAGAVLLGLLAVPVIIGKRSVRWIERVVSLVSPRWGQRAAGFVESFGDGLRRLRELRGGSIAEIAVLSVLMWTANAVTAAIVFHGLGNAAPVGFGVALFTVAMIAFGMFVPVTPAGLGQFHAMVVIALGVFGVGREAGMSVALVLHGVLLAVTILLGVPFVYREHVGIARLERVREATDDRLPADSGTPAVD